MKMGPHEERKRVPDRERVEIKLDSIPILVRVLWAHFHARTIKLTLKTRINVRCYRVDMQSRPV